MKVLLISPYGSNIVGGIVSWTKNIVSYYQNNKRNIDLRLLNNTEAVGLYGTGTMLQRIRVGLNNYMPIVRELRTLLNKEKIDIVHISSSASLGLIRDIILNSIAHKHGAKTIVHMHFGYIPQMMQTRGWEKTLFKGLLKRIDQAVVMDQASFKVLQNAGFTNISYLPNPLSPEVQKLIEKHSAVPRISRKIVFVGHILEAKGVYELVEACASIPDIRLELIGHIVSDKIKNELYNIGGDNSRQWLSIPGNKSLDEVIISMKSCSLFVLPTYTEGFPNVILESMACGCPIITTPVGAIPEMLDISGPKPCGICVPPKDIVRLREAILYLLDNHHIASELGKNAFVRVNEEYVMSKIWERLVEIWRKQI